MRPSTRTLSPNQPLLLPPAPSTPGVPYNGMTAIDLFAGAGGFTIAAKMAGVKVLWAGNHWPLAVQYHGLNNEETLHVCQDLQQANWMEVPQHAIILASPACLPAHALIVMGNGEYRRVSQLETGDMVLTHAGRSRAVVNIWRKKYSGDMLHFRIWGNNREPLSMTADHQVWIRRRGGKYSKLSEPVFVRADQVQAGDYIAYPRWSADDHASKAFLERQLPERVGYTSNRSDYGPRQSSLPGSKTKLLSTDPELWWLVGQYLGDGGTRSDRPDVEWSVGQSSENRERLSSILTRHGLKSWHRGPKNNQRLFCSSTHLRAVLGAFGAKAYNKFIPPEVIGFAHEEIKNLIEGYLAADGSQRLGRDNPTWVATSVSLPLLQGLQRLCWQIGWSAGIQIGGKAGEVVIEGRTVQCRDSWTITIRKSPHVSSRSKFTDTHVWRSVRSIEVEVVKDEEVFDFEVEEDHTFCLPGMVVHNCQGHAKARGKERPHHDAQRSTAWAVVACAEYHRSSAVIVENVPEFLDWVLYPAWKDAMQRLGYSVAEYVLDAADFGVPQNRERMFLVCTRSKHPVELRLDKVPHVPVNDFLEWDNYEWQDLYTKGKRNPQPRAAATLERYARGRQEFGERFVAPYYGSGSGETGRSVWRPIGTITTRDRWTLVNGERSRFLRVPEARRIMGFPEDYLLPATHREAMEMLGNAVCPPVPASLLNALRKAA